jgi:protein-tyrosine-phosphatase
MNSSHRRYKLAIWGLALGYFIFYAPYAALIKITTSGLWPGLSGRISGFRLLPAVVISTAIVLPLIVSLRRWWKYAGRRHILSLNVPFPHPLIFLSGLGTAIIIGTTTLIFTFDGVSIVFALVLMRGGVLIMSPVVDRIFGRRVRWFSWAALAATALAVSIALSDVNNYRLSTITVVIIAGYLSGYLLRLPCATRLAKSTDPTTTWRYFVEEQMVAMLFLVAIPVLLALIGRGEIMMELRQGFAGLFTSSITVPALIIGALYAGLYYFGTLIYLDCRENTYCIPLNRGSSLLAGFFASVVLSLSLGQRLPSAAQLGSTALIVTALLMLSPFHHVLERAFSRFRLLLGRATGRLLHVGASTQTVAPSRTFLFVCSGNTCRSPMAAAITNAEIATRLNIPFESLETVNVRALSAGISAKVGAPLTAEAQQVLRSLNVPVGPHAASNLTFELADQAEMIFCMTSAHRKAVIEMIPSVAGKTYCLDPDGEIEDPIGKGLAAYVRCAQRIQELVRLRFGELDLVREMVVS